MFFAIPDVYGGVFVSIIFTGLWPTMLCCVTGSVVDHSEVTGSVIGYSEVLTKTKQNGKRVCT